MRGTLLKEKLMSAFTLAKLAAQVVTGLGVHKIVSDVITSNVTVVTNFDAVRVAAGGLVLSSMAVDKASEHLELRIEQARQWYENQKDKNGDQ